MPFRHFTKYQLSARIRAQRAAHRDLAGKAGSLARREEIRRELTKLLAARAQRASPPGGAVRPNTGVPVRS
jgi:hypothetical protein